VAVATASSLPDAEQFRSAVRGWASDPVRFAREILGVTTLWSRQEEILRSLVENRETSVPSGHGTGKDFTASIAVLWWLLCEPDSIAITTAHKALQVEKILWGEIRARAQKARVPLGDGLAPSAPSWSIGPKWYAIGLTASDPNGFAGFHGRRVLLVRDEAAGIAPPIWDAAESCASGDGDRILNIGNPICGPTHPFSKACGLRDEPGKRRVIRVSTEETPNAIAGRTVIPGLSGRAYIQSMAEKHGRDSVTFGARVRGVFPLGSADGLISFAHLQVARDRLAGGVKPGDGDVVRLGCDPARYGDDLTTIYAARGPFAWEVATLSKQDGEPICEALVKVANELRAVTVAIDSTGGYGSAPTDFFRKALREKRVKHSCRVVEVNFGSASHDPEQWANARTELWWRMRDWIRDVAAIDCDDLLAEDLIAPTYKPHGQGIALEPKEVIKRRLGRSPDRGDGLALALSGHLFGGGEEAPLLMSAPSATELEVAETFSVPNDWRRDFE
jgi:phage terminase large subunit